MKSSMQGRDIWKTERNCPSTLQGFTLLQFCHQIFELRAGGNRRLGLTSQLGSLSLEEWIRLQKRLGESRSGAPTCPSALLEGWHWYGRKFKCGPGHMAEATMMVSPHSDQLFPAFSTWRCMFVWKKKPGLILSHHWHLRGHLLSLERLPKKPPSFGDRGTQFYFEKNNTYKPLKNTKV